MRICSKPIEPAVAVACQSPDSTARKERETNTLTRQLLSVFIPLITVTPFAPSALSASIRVHPWSATKATRYPATVPAPKSETSAAPHPSRSPPPPGRKAPADCSSCSKPASPERSQSAPHTSPACARSRSTAPADTSTPQPHWRTGVAATGAGVATAATGETLAATCTRAAVPGYAASSACRNSFALCHRSRFSLSSAFITTAESVSGIRGFTRCAATGRCCRCAAITCG